MVLFTVHLCLILLVGLYCFRRVCACWHYQDSRFCHSALVVLDGVYMRMKSIDSSLLALWRLIHKLGLPHTCVGVHWDKRTHTNADTEARSCWHLTFYRKWSGDQLTRSCCQSKSIRPLPSIPHLSTFAQSIFIKKSVFSTHEEWQRVRMGWGGQEG